MSTTKIMTVNIASRIALQGNVAGLDDVTAKVYPILASGSYGASVADLTLSELTGAPSGQNHYGASLTIASAGKYLLSVTSPTDAELNGLNRIIDVRDNTDKTVSDQISDLSNKLDVVSGKIESDNVRFID